MDQSAHSGIRLTAKSDPPAVAGNHPELARKSCESDHLARAADATDRNQALVEGLLTLAREGEGTNEIDPVVLTGVVDRSRRTADTGRATLETGVLRASLTGRVAGFGTVAGTAAFVLPGYVLGTRERT